MNQVIVIGVCGCSCSGKTSTVEKIATTLDKCATNSPIIVSQDSYYLGGNTETNYDVPQALEFSLMVEHVKQLINGQSVEAPIYDFKTHSRKEETKTLQPSRVIIIEGTLIFTQEELRNLCTLKVFVSAYPELMFARRLKRDVEDRGRSITEVNERYLKDVMPSNKIYVEPSENYADIVLKNNVQGKFIGLKILLGYLKCI